MTRAGWAGRRVLVTGASSGIGAETMELLGELGAVAVGLDLSPPAAQHQRASVHVHADVADSASVRDAVRAAVDTVGGMDVVVNNAAVSAVGSVDTFDEQEWRRVLEVNVLGVARVSAEALPHLRRGDDPAIVNVSSFAASVGVPGRALYSASKGAVSALTLAMAADHVHEGIRVNAVCPGTTDTPWVGRLVAATADPGRTRAELERRQPTGRLVGPEEVARAIAFLAAPGSRSMTGTILTVDGGATRLRVPDSEQGDGR